MEHSTVKSIGFLPTLAVSLFLLAVTFGTNNVQAAQVTPQPANSTQLAWWGGGWGGGWNHGWHRGWGGNYGPVYYGCARHCWINRWGHRRCACY